MHVLHVLHAPVPAVGDAALGTTQSAMALLGGLSPVGLSGSPLPQRSCCNALYCHDESQGASRHAASDSPSATLISKGSTDAPSSAIRLALKAAGSIVSIPYRSDCQAAAAKKDVLLAGCTPRRPHGLASSNRAPRPQSRHHTSSSPHTLASCRTPTQTPVAVCTVSFLGTSAEAKPAQSTSGEAATMLGQATHAATAAWSDAGCAVSTTALRKRIRVTSDAQSPEVLLEMTSSPASSRPKQHVAKQLPTAAKEAVTSPQKALPPTTPQGGLRAQLQAAARQAAAAATTGPRCSAAESAVESPEDDEEQACEVNRELRRAIDACKRLREEMENMSSWGPAVGNLAAAVELEEPEEETPVPPAPLRMRRVSFNLPEPPRKPKGGSPASFYFTSISPKKVASWPRQQLGLKRKLGSLSPHKAFRSSRLPGSPHHCWAPPSAQATLHTAPSRLPAAGTKPVEDASAGLEAETEEEGLLNLVRRLSYERPARPPKRARTTPCPQVPTKQGPAPDMVEQEFREAFMNSSLAQNWLAGEDWAALDYNGLVLSHAAASAHRAKHQEVLERMKASKRQVAAEQLIEQLEREWQQLRSIRQRYASAPAAAQGGQGCGSAEARQTPAKSILKRRSLGALREILEQMPLGETDALWGSQAQDNMKALTNMI